MGDPFSDTKLKVCLSRGCAHQHLGRTVDLTWECEVSITRKDGRACDVFDQESRGLPLQHDDILQRLPMPCSLVYDNLHALVYGSALIPVSMQSRLQILVRGFVSGVDSRARAVPLVYSYRNGCKAAELFVIHVSCSSFLFRCSSTSHLHTKLLKITNFFSPPRPVSTFSRCSSHRFHPPLYICPRYMASPSSSLETRSHRATQ